MRRYPLAQKFIEDLDLARRGIVLAVAETQVAWKHFQGREREVFRRIENASVNGDINHSTEGVINHLEQFLQTDPDMTPEGVVMKFMELQ